ncbi:uncharacterized protein LOC131154982 isoform X1 [Malania oleifera]|uniref:uncharacterized protein LOC131154982 isoform X1 n=1 Tax=Malania oleifera TaxID=397392 RepID=UPI0025ADFFAA|nr:uncharacterized protein LOC131154982 isoform X1 [Malania oleifera]XP_057963833.1 uncharacterized protein LOC131154982 isoform X1 [Malania oleifera]
MDENSNENKTLMERVQQLEHERDELHKDIEQLCMQQAGPSYLAVATRMHFQRTASLEQEIENLKKKLAACTRDNLNLQEELSEAYRIKSQLADLHGAEVSKNMEVEKQVKFFQNCVAAAFSERDHSLMEAEKAKEKEELISLKLNDLQNRVEELTSDCHEQKKLNAKLQVDLAQLKMQNEIFKKVIDKFYEIRQNHFECFEGISWDEKCSSLLHDPEDLWTFNNHEETSTSKYISDLEHELETLRKSVDNLQYKLRMGLEIENHLKKRVSELEKKQICSEEMIKSGISGLLHYHSQHRVHITKILDEGKSHLKSIIDMVDEKIGQLGVSRELDLKPLVRNIKLDENECQDVYISNDADPNLVAERDGPGLPVLVAGGIGNASEALAIALKEKVGALLLLSQQEERHLLERNVNATLQKKLEELQRNLLQVTNEKVKALMELAQLKQEYQLLREKIDHEKKRGNFLADAGERNVAHERDGKLKSLLKKTYLRRWVGSPDFSGNEIEANLKNEATCSGRRSNYSMDFARMKIENATLRESMECMEHLTSSIQRLRLSLLKAKESVASESKLTGMPEALEDIISEAKLVKTALGSSLPVSWSAEVGVESAGESNIDGPGDVCGDSSHAKIDSVSAAGFEMVELLILAAQMLRGSMRSSRDGS